MRSIHFTDALRRRLRRGLFVSILAVSSVATGHSPHHIITDLAVERAPNNVTDVYVLITDQVFRSSDRNSPWKQLENGLDIRHPYVSVDLSPAYRSDDTVYLATAGDGVFRSRNRGEHWQRVNEGLGNPVLSDLFVWSSGPDEHRLLAAGSAGGLWLRASSEDEWQRVLSDEVRVTSFATEQTSFGQAFVWLGDATGRLWHSTDGGLLWESVVRLEQFGAITDIVVDGEQLYLGTSGAGLLKGNGASYEFQRVQSFAPQRVDDCHGQALDDPLPDDHITSIRVSPDFEADSTMYVTTWYNALHVSTDAGATWKVQADGLSCDPQAESEGLPHFSKLEIGDDGQGNAVLWLAAFDGLFRAEHSGFDWRQFETLPLGLIKGFATDSNTDGDPVTALATYGGGFYLTPNLGKTWRIGNRGLVTTRLTGIAFASDASGGRRIYAGASRRLLWSGDDGRSWHRVDLQEYGIGAGIAFKLQSWGAPSGLSRLFYDPADHPLVYPTHIVAGVDPEPDTVYFATRFHGILSWNQAGGVESVWSGTDRIINSFDASPDFVNDRTLFASIRGEGLMRSVDAGETWLPVNDDLDFVDDWSANPDGRNFRRDVRIAISPDFTNDGTVFAGAAAASGLFVSRDGGDRWRRTGLLIGLKSAPVLAVALSPDFETDDTMVVSVKGHGLYRSMDRGASFDAIGPTLLDAHASVEHLAFSNGGIVVAASDEAMYVSRDYGKSWQLVRRPVRYEDMRHVVRFSGEWHEEKGQLYSAMTERVTNQDGATAGVRFFGTGIRWIGSTGPEFGGARVKIDGQLVDTVSARSDEVSVLTTIFSIEDLPYGLHELEIVSDNSFSGSARIAVDAFDVLDSDSD